MAGPRPAVIITLMRRLAALLLGIPVATVAQEAPAPPLLEYVGRAALVVEAHCELQEHDFLFGVRTVLKGEMAGPQLRLKVREANLSRLPEAEAAELRPGTDYLLFLKPFAVAGRPPRPPAPGQPPEYMLFDGTRGAVALQGPEGKALAILARRLAALAAVPVATREAAIRERFLALAGRVGSLSLDEGFELTELARAIDKYSMGTAEMSGPLLAVSAHPPAPLAAAILRVLTQIFTDGALPPTEAGLLAELALRHSLAAEPALRRQAVAALRLIDDPRAEARLEILGREDADQHVRLAAQTALLDRREGRIRGVRSSGP